MVLGIITLLIAILAAVGLFREFKRKNFFAVGFAAITIAVFGWFSIRTILSIIFPESS
ncbi:Protein of unknown function [Evansella caseinilytica]|uniref:DUF2759 domain-containing protein n=1 Tax=Evansella caseinilytica TaxID=1503961 RepID=A0A1H3KS00_9BACI|nr:DUF2759 domain-containing protein [Evansella caseinilytica]SDY54860.1 Protein of unknown function [Evansella caseinilytica]